MNNLSDIFDSHKKAVIAFIDGVRDEAYEKGKADGIREFLPSTNLGGDTFELRKETERRRSMTKEKIRQKAIECGHAFNTMCNSKECEIDEEFNTICHCEYNEVANVAPCRVAYGYEHGFADGVEEGKQIALEIINSMDFDFGDFYDHTRRIKEMIAEALHCTEGEEE